MGRVNCSTLCSNRWKNGSNLGGGRLGDRDFGLKAPKPSTLGRVSAWFGTVRPRVQIPAPDH